MDLPDPGPVRDARDALTRWLRADRAPGLVRLEDYHSCVDDTAHEDVHWAASEWVWAQRLGRSIVLANRVLVDQLVGLDVHVQRYPYLRIARPGRREDVTGLHRDTHYGASPWELSMVIPFTDVPTGAAVQVVTGSHAEPPDAYPAVRRESPGVAPGSRAHRMGFPYAPQELAPDVAARAVPVELGVGQTLLFGLGLVHGQTVAIGSTTRVSIDVRVVNPLAPVALARGVRDDYYEPLGVAPLTRLARRYSEPGAG